MYKEIDLNNYYFYNFPLPLKEKDYWEVCDLVVKSLKDNPNIKSIYLAGGKWVPGISDLDILIVYHQKIKNRVNILSPWNLSKNARYIFCHNYGSYNEKSFRNIFYIIPPTSLKLLWGKTIPVHNPKNELSRENYQFLNAILIFDILINKLLFFPSHLKSSKINVRALIGKIYSLKYTLEMLRYVGSYTIETDFPERISKLRKIWFNRSRKENLSELLSLYRESNDIVLEIVSKLSAFAQNQNLPMRNIIFKNRKYYIVFKSNWTKERFLNNFFQGYIYIKKPFSNRIIENFKLVLPLPLSYFLMAYANYQGPLSTWIKKSITNFQKIVVPINRGIQKHIQTTNDFVQSSIDHNGLFKIPFPYGYLVKKQKLLSYLGEKLILFLRTIKK